MRLDRRSPGHCRATFDHPPINTITAATVAELAELVGLIERDRDLNVVVFDSANRDFYLSQLDTRTGMDAWLDLLVRLSRAPVVSIASIRGRARGAGSEFALACDLRFASRENAMLGEFEPGGGMIAGDEPMARLCRLVGRSRALEILLVGGDLDGRRAEQYGCVNRAIPDDRLDDEVEAVASRLACLDHDTVAHTKSYVRHATPPPDSGLPPRLGDRTRIPSGTAMSMLCRSYATAGDARAAVARLLAAGVPGDAVRVVMSEPTGSSQGDGDHLRGDSHADADRDTVTTFPGGIATERVASHRALAGLLRTAGVDPAAVDASVRAVRAGRVLVLLHAGSVAAVPGALDAT